VKLEAVKISVSWVQFESRCWLVAPGTELLVSCSCISYCKSQSNRYGKQQTAFAFHLFTLKKYQFLYLMMRDDFPHPSKPRRNCFTWNGLCHPAAALLGFFPVPPPSPGDSLSRVRVGVCSRPPCNDWSPIVFWPQLCCGLSRFQMVPFMSNISLPLAPFNPFQA
jgi:hypothetical protein